MVLFGLEVKCGGSLVLVVHRYDFLAFVVYSQSFAVGAFAVSIVCCLGFVCMVCCLVFVWGFRGVLAVWIYIVSLLFVWRGL